MSHFVPSPSRDLSPSLDLSLWRECTNIRWNTASTKDVSIGKVLRSQVTDSQAREHNLCARLDNLFELVVDDLPLSLDDRLVCLWSLSIE